MLGLFVRGQPPLRMPKGPAREATVMQGALRNEAKCWNPNDIWMQQSLYTTDTGSWLAKNWGVKREEEVADETHRSPHHRSVLFLTQLSGTPAFTCKSVFHPHSVCFKNDCCWLQWSWGRPALLTNQVSQVLLKDTIKEGEKTQHSERQGFKEVSRRPKYYVLLHQFYPSSRLLCFSSSPGHKHYVCAYHKGNCLGILRSVTNQWRRLTFFSTVVRKPSTKLGSKKPKL